MPRKSTKKQPKKRSVRTATRAAPPPALKDHARWLRSVFEHSALGIARLDNSARILDANAAFEHFFGRRMPELCRRPIREFASAEDAETIVTLVAESLAGQHSAGREVRFVRPDG